MSTIKKTEADQLDTLAAQADALDLPAPGAAPGGEGGEVAAPALTNAQCLSLGYEMARDTLCSFAKVHSPKSTLSNDVIKPMAEAQAAVLDKYGISLQSLGGDYMLEIKAAIVTVPVLLAFRAALVVEMQDLKKLSNPETETAGAAVEA